MSSVRTAVNSLEDIEIGLLLEGLYRAHGFDFRDYSRSSIKRRILELMRAEKLETISAFQDRVLHDAASVTVIDASIASCSVYQCTPPRCFATPASTSPFEKEWCRY